MKKIILLGLLSIIISCNSQNKNFKFEYLNLNNSHLKDSVKLKLNLYFNNYDLNEANVFLNDINKYKELKEKYTDREYFYSKIFNEPKLLPRHHLKIKEVDEELIFSNFVIDSTFYRGFKTKSLVFIAEQHYKKLEGLRIEREEYNQDINSIIKFRYYLKHPFFFKGESNEIVFNMDFQNMSSMEIKFFEGIILVNNESETLINFNINSDVIDKESLNVIHLNYWDNLMKRQYTRWGKRLSITLNDYNKSMLKENYEKLVMFFIPTKIEFNNGKTMYQ